MRLGKRLKKSSTWKKAGATINNKGTKANANSRHQNKPKHVSRDSVVGRVDPDLITSVYAPQFLEMASETLEQYADDLMQYEELLAAYDQQKQQQQTETEAQDANATKQAQTHARAKVEVEADGTIKSTTTTATTTSTDGERLLPPPPVEPTPPLFRSQYRIDEFAQLLADTSDHFFAKTGGWRVHANAAKFERMLDEKYGVFRPFITNHPGVEQFIRQMQRKYAMGDFSPIRSKPPIPRSTSVILLFLMQRGKMQWEVLTLAFLFLLVGLQPWALVACVAVAHAMVMRRKARPTGRRMKESARQSVQAYYRKSNDATADDGNSVADKETAPNATPQQEQARKYKLLSQPVGIPLKENETLDTANYDTIILGSGASCLFAAALLSRAGRRVLVLCPDNADASECVTLEHPKDHRFRNVPFDIGACNMSKISRQQKLLAPALCTDHDCQGGIRFAQIGSKADGHAFEILSVPGVGTDRADQHVPFVLKADGGVNSLMEDAAAYLGDGWPGMDGSVGHSSTGSYVKACEQMNASAGEYYLGKILPESTAKYRSTSMYQTAASKYAESIINQYFPLNAHARSLMAAVGLKNESLRPSKASMAAHITNVCAAMSGEGMHYPVGGPRALCHGFATVVEQLGGRIVTNATIAELLFAEDPESIAETPSAATAKATANVTDNATKESKLPPPTCVGVKLSSGTEVRFAPERFKSITDSEKPAIVSMLPFITTYIRVFPSDIRTKYGCPRGLGALAEQRPVFKFVFALDGNANDLSLTGADYYRVPSAALAVDEMDTTTNAVKHGEIGWADTDERTVSASDTGDNASAIDSQSVDEQKRRTSHQKRYERGVSWIHVSFPSAKDPSFAPRYGNISTCVVTIEADDDFAIDMGSKPRIFQTKKASAGVVEDLRRLQERVQGDLIDIFPQLEGKIKQVQVVGPRSRGMNHTPERFVVKGVHALSPYKRLFYGGPDLTIGENFSAAMVAAWLASNAVAGYTVVDHLFLQKNITSDLGQFLEDPGADDDDVAVPFQTTPTVMAQDS